MRVSVPAGGPRGAHDRSAESTFARIGNLHAAPQTQSGEGCGKLADDLRFAGIIASIEPVDRMGRDPTIGLGTVITAVLAVSMACCPPLPYADPSCLAIVDGRRRRLASGSTPSPMAGTAPLLPTRLAPTRRSSCRAAREAADGAGAPSPRRCSPSRRPPLWGELFTSDTATTVVISERLARQIVEQAGASESGDRRSADASPAGHAVVGHHASALYVSADARRWVPARSVGRAPLDGRRQVVSSAGALLARDCGPGVRRRPPGERRDRRTAPRGPVRGRLRAVARRSGLGAGQAGPAGVHRAASVLLVARQCRHLAVGRFVRGREFAIRSIGASVARLIRTSRRQPGARDRGLGLRSR